MKTLIPAVFLLIALTTPAWARLGENEDQLMARYGKPLGKSKTPAQGQQVALEEMQFEKSGFEIFVSLYNGSSSEEQIDKKTGDSMTDEELKTLLDINAQGHNWKEEDSKNTHSKKWSRDDGATAVYNGREFQVKTKELIDAEKAASDAAYKAAHTTSLEGF